MNILGRNIKFPQVFIDKLDKFSQNEKFSLLKEFIELNKIQFEESTFIPNIINIMDFVLSFFQNRSKWNKLIIAQELVAKYNSNINNQNIKTTSLSSKYTVNSKIFNTANSKIFNSFDKSAEILHEILHETDEIKVIYIYIANF